MSDISTAEFDTGPPVEPQEADAARSAAASRTARGALKKDPNAFLPRVADEAAYAELSPGSEYLDPTGNRRRKLYEVKHATDYAKVPEGETYLDPDGNERSKPKYEGISYTAQTLYNMSTNDKERRRALERSYPGQVQEGVEGLYVDDGGVLRRPKGFTDAPASMMSGMAGPTVGAVGGEVGGGLVANLPGAIGGAAAGSALGQGFNDIILGLTGVYDRSLGEQATETGLAAGFGAGGATVGRVIAPAITSAASAGKVSAPGVAAAVVGADKEGLEAAIAMREKGLKLAPLSMWAKEAPRAIQLSEVLDPSFRTQQPLKQAAEAYYEQQAGKIIAQTGGPPEASLLAPKSAVPVEETGRMLQKAKIDQRAAELAKADADLAEKTAATRQAAEARMPITPEQQEALRVAGIEARGKANLLIRAGFDDIEQGVDAAMKVAKAGSNSGDLWQSVGEKLQALHGAVGERYRTGRQAAIAAAGDTKVDITGLQTTAQQFLDRVPEQFQKRMSMLKDITRIAEGEGEGALSFEKAVELRTQLRMSADWYDLPSDQKNGLFKYFAGQLNDAIQNVGRQEGKEAAQGFSRKEVSRFTHPELGPGDPAIDQFLTRGKPLLTMTREEMDAYGVGDQLKQAAGARSTEFMADGRVPSTVFWQPGKESEAKRLVELMSKPDLENPAHHRDVGKLLGYPQGEIDAFVGVEASAGRNAVKMLNETDAWYADNIKLYHAKNLQSILRGLESGEPADPVNLASALRQAGHTDLTNKIMDKLGPALAGAVRAADVQSMLDASQTLGTGQINGSAFAKEILERVKDKTLFSFHGQEMGEKLLKQAQNIEVFDGKLPLNVRPGDTALDIIGKARLAAEIADNAARQDPLKSLAAETRKIEGLARKEASQRNEEWRKSDPLSFLVDPTVLASKAATRILGSEDLILAYASQFGSDSPGFEALRQIYVRNFFRNTMEPGLKAAKMSPAVQELIFPGVSLSDMQVLAKEMEFLAGSKGIRDFGQSLQGATKVASPGSSVPGGVSLGKATFGASNVMIRPALTAYYKFVTEFWNDIPRMKWILKGLQGDDAAREMVRQQVQRSMQVGGAVGAGASEATYQTPTQPGSQ